MIWEIFRHADAIAIGDKLDRRNRLKSSTVLSDMTPGERAFAMAMEHLLNNTRMIPMALGYPKPIS